MMDATVSNEMLHTTLLEIRSDVKELKLTKVDLAMHDKDMEILDLKIEPIRKDISVIKGYVKWVAITIIGGVGAAVLDLVIARPK